MNNTVENEYMEKFANITIALSPENISCDGERTNNEIKMAEKELLAEWKLLEKEYNVSVTADDVYNWETNKEKKKKPTI